jgi:Uncharacterized protein conserved in bacteria (DUF2252)
MAFLGRPGDGAVGRLDSGVSGLTPAERVARSKAARAEAPRESHAVFDPSPDRTDPIALLEEQAKSRVPELVPVRWGRMAVSPFTFYRGAALPMAKLTRMVDGRPRIISDPPLLVPINELMPSGTDNASIEASYSGIISKYRRTLVTDRVEAGLDGQPRAFYVRQLRDWKFSIEIGALLSAGAVASGRITAERDV